jgi:hypothetical protein
MSSDLSAETTAIATAVLAAFAIITAVVASLAFRKQSKAVEDSRKLIGQQGAMLQVQSERLEVYRTQVDEQRQINGTRLETLDLQAREIRASLDQRERVAEKERRSQAEKVTAWFAEDRHAIWGARIRNASDLPVLDVRTFFHYIHETQPGGEWAPVMRGATIERIRVLPPQSDRFIEIPGQVRNQIREVSDQIYVVSIEFTDAAGNRWERDPRGALNART